MSKANNLKDFLIDLANAIREKKNKTGAINPQDFSAEIKSIVAGDVQMPNVSGTLVITEGITEDDYEALKLVLGNNITIDAQGGIYIHFEDPEVLRVLLANGVGDGTGITTAQAEAVTNIGTWFRGNTAITEFDEFEKFTGVNKLGGYAFTKCTLLKSLIIPSTITTIESSSSYLDGTFNNCTSLIGVGSIENIERIGNFVFFGCTSLSEISFSKNNLKLIGNSAFYNCTSLEIDDLSLPNLETLGQNAFYGVKIKKISNLGKITALPTATTSTQNFGDKSMLEEVVLPEGVVAVPSMTFRDYAILKRVVLPSSIKTLGTGTSNGDGVFLNCSALSEINLPNGLTTIGSECFRNCTSLNFGSIPDTVTSIGIYAFNGTLNKTIKIPEGVSIVSRFICANCSKLQVLDIPSTTTKIEWSILNNASATTLVCRATTPPTKDGEAFKGSNLSEIYVPDASVEAYKTASGWTASADKIKPLSEYTG